MLIDFLITLTSLSKSEILAHTGAHVGAYAATEAVHLKLILGHAVSAFAGYAMMRMQLIRIIEKTRATAKTIHQDILALVASHNQWSVTPL